MCNHRSTEDMYNLEKLQSDSRLRKNPGKPSFSSSLLDEICRSIGGEDDEFQEMKFCRETPEKKQSKVSIDDEEIAGLRRACLIEKWMGQKADNSSLGRRRLSLPELDRKSYRDVDGLFFHSCSTSSDSSLGGFSFSETESYKAAKSQTSCFAALRPKPIATNVSASLKRQGHGGEVYFFNHCYQSQNHENLKDEGGLIKSKWKALKLCSNLKKIKQPISPGGRFTSFLNSLLTNGSPKKTKSWSSSSNSRSVGGYADTSLKTKSNSAELASSRSCLGRSSPSWREKSNGGAKTAVRLYPVTVGDDCRPRGHKLVYQGDSRKLGRLPEFRSNEGLRLHEKNRKFEENARDSLKAFRQQRNDDGIIRRVCEEDDDIDDCASDSSSDLFELDHLAMIGNSSYCQELPVYGNYSY